MGDIRKFHLVDCVGRYVLPCRMNGMHELWGVQSYVAWTQLKWPDTSTVPIPMWVSVQLRCSVYLNSWFVLKTTFYVCHCAYLLFIIAFN